MRITLSNFLRNKFIAIPIIAITLIGTFSMGYFYSNSFHDKMNLNGTFTLYENGKTVYTDEITYTAWGTVFCKVFNDSNACSKAYYNFMTAGGIGTPCTNPNGITTAFFSQNYCIMTAIALSTDTTQITPLASCPAIQTASGLAPAQATTSYSINTNTITLSASWTPSTAITLNKVCLIAWNTNAGTYYFYNYLGTPFAIEAITNGFTTASGVAFSATWVFSL